MNNNICVNSNKYTIDVYYPFVTLSVPRCVPVNLCTDWSEFGVSEVDEETITTWLLEN